jgi:elongation factor P
MAYYSTNELKASTKVLYEGDPCSVIENEYVKPGKGQAFNRLKLRNLKSGRVMELTLKSGDRLEAADLIEIAVDYLYRDNHHWHFMAPDTYEQYTANEAALNEARHWLKPQARCHLMLFNGEPLTVISPNSVVLAVQETDPGVRGDTSGGGSKPATLETGVVVRVPLFVQIGDFIKVDTREGIYLERAKE